MLSDKIHYNPEKMLNFVILLIEIVLAIMATEYFMKPVYSASEEKCSVYY